jgi:hypothetical protein
LLFFLLLLLRDDLIRELLRGMIPYGIQIKDKQVTCDEKIRASWHPMLRGVWRRCMRIKSSYDDFDRDNDYNGVNDIDNDFDNDDTTPIYHHTARR